MTKKEISDIIDTRIFEDLEKEDLKASEMSYLKTRFAKNNIVAFTSEGLMDLIYSAYKLGFCKAYMSMGKEIPGKGGKK